MLRLLLEMRGNRPVGYYSHVHAACGHQLCVNMEHGRTRLVGLGTKGGKVKKITAAQLEELHRLHRASASDYRIAKELGLSRSRVGRIVRDGKAHGVVRDGDGS
ncbi:hypothetical protein ACFL59_03365 [Planctomycetota bacterium]